MKGNRIRAILAACLLGFWLARPTLASAESIDDLGQWTAIFAQGDVGHEECGDSDLRWWFDGQLRLFDDPGGFGQSLIRPGIGYKLSENAAVWAGYAWIRTSPPGTVPTFDEQRSWQQVTTSHELDLGKLDLRSRLEERFVETGSEMGWRFRQLAALRRPFADPRYTFVAWDEVFFHLNDTDWGARDGFDQNRAFLGLGWRPDQESTWRIETGYMNQFVHRPTQDELSNHILSINLFWNP